VEYASQVVGNAYESGKGLSAFTELSTYTNVDASDIVIAAGVGAATGGLSGLTATFTKTAIAGGIATVNALGEGAKAAVDVDVKGSKGVEVTSFFTGDKSAGKAAVEFVVGNIPTPDIVEGPIKSGVEAAGQAIINSAEAVLTEAVEKKAKDQIDN
jgi:hypothetical protein